MNEYILVIIATLLFLSLPKVLGHIREQIGLKKIKLVFDNKQKLKGSDIKLINNNPKRSRVRKLK